MFGKKFYSLVSGAALEDPKADYKLSRFSGQYRLSSRAIYRSDGGYVPFAAVKECVHDRASVHVSGCCAGGVSVERIVFITENEKIPLLFDTKKQVTTVLNLVEACRAENTQNTENA